MSRLVMIDQKDVSEYWTKLRNLFKEAVTKGHGEYLLGDILSQALRGNVQLACIEDGDEILMALALEVKKYPAMIVLNVMAMAGQRMAELFKEHYLEIASFAKSCGASQFEASGSPAVEKMLCKSGWHDVYRVVRFNI